MSKLTADDYLDWLAGKPFAFEIPKLPKHKRRKDKPERDRCIAPVPLYKCRELGQSYANRYQEEHAQEALQLLEREKDKGESVDEEEFELNTSVDTTCRTEDVAFAGAACRDSAVAQHQVSFDKSMSCNWSGARSTFQKPEISLLDDDSDTETLTGAKDDTAEDITLDKVCTNTTGDPSLAALEEDTMLGSVSVARSLDTTVIAQQQLKVYKQYNFDHRDATAEQLPVFKQKQQILNKINSYQVVVIEGHTGSGKSTQVPQYILDEGAEEGRHVNICVTQPRKIAAVTLAKRVCDERQWKLGSLVGYHVGLDNCTSEDTRLCYMTTEVLVQQLIGRKSLDLYTHIVLDEVHERDQHTDFALLLVKKLLNTVSRSIKVVLMSATIEVEKFAKYYATPVLGRLLPAPVIAISDPAPYNTSIFYLDQLVPTFGQKATSLMQNTEPRLSEELCELVVEIAKRFDLVESNHVVSSTSAAQFTHKGAVLVFVPGLMEIEMVITKMRACAVKEKWMLYPLHSSITLEEQKGAFVRCEPGYRKIIVATNIAESSITVADVRYVVDTCLTKTLRCDPVTNYTSLQLDWASKASCNQRAGRAGRTGNGRVYRLISYRFYASLASYTTPELVRCPLSIAVLKTKRLDMGEPVSLLALALDPPNIADIARTVLDLKQLGCLSVSPAKTMSALDGELTHLGDLASQLPLDPHLSKLIVLGQALGCLRETIVIAAGLSLKSFHSKPFQDELNAHLSKMSWAHGSFSDCIALLNAYDVWQNLHCRQAFREFNKGNRDGDAHLLSAKTKESLLRTSSFDANISASERHWAKRSYVQLQQLREVHKLVEELTDRLRALKVVPVNLQQPTTHHQDTVLKLCIAGAFFPLYFNRVRGEDYEVDTHVELSGHNPFNTVLLRRLPLHSAVIYEPQIRELFKECASDVAIEIENSKAYVMFPRARAEAGCDEPVNSIPGEFPTAMYLALKMVQVPRIKDSLYINLFSAADTTKLLSALEEESQLKQQCAEHHNDNTSTLDGDTNSTLSCDPSCLSSSSRVLRYGSQRVLSASACCFKPAELPSPDTLSWNIKVVHVESAGRVWALSEGAATVKLHFVISTINFALGSEDAPLITADKFTGGSLPVNEPVLAPRHDASGAVVYARAQIEKFRSSPRSQGVDNSKKVKVFFVDYGHSALVSPSSLRQMPEVLGSVPRLAVECCLIRVRPVSSSCGGAAWSEAANKFARSWLTDKTFQTKVYSIVHGVVRIELYDKLSPHDQNLKSFNSLLVEKGFAVVSQESLESQDDHRNRQQHIYSTNLPSTFPTSTSFPGSCEPLCDRSSMSLSSQLSTLSLVSDSATANIQPTRNKSRLLGPYSPLQLQFQPLQCATLGKEVCVESESINSTALDMEPQNPHDRLLVSSFVSLSGNERRLVARNTTLMPAVPGLLSICCLTFCHLAEMRVSKDGCEYTGALIGLGADPQTGLPVYPDEDIELAFDIPFTNYDLEKINKVRYLLNCLLCGPVGRPGALDPAARAERQKLLRHSLLQLLDENRQYMRPVRSVGSYKWNMVPPASLLKPITEADEVIEGVPVYPLHYGVALRCHTPASLLRRANALAREYLDMMRSSSSSRHLNSGIWERCYACNKKLLLTMQDIGEHLDSDAHQQRIQELKCIVEYGG